jgi:hypothetical protein
MNLSRGMKRSKIDPLPMPNTNSPSLSDPAGGMAESVSTVCPTIHNYQAIG